MKKMIKAIALLGLILIVPLLGHRAHKHYIYDYKGMSVVRLTGEFAGRYSGGTGFQIKAPSGEQYTLTNNHVCMLAQDDGLIEKQLLTAEDWKGNFYTIRIIEIYKDHDLCLLEGIEALPSLSLAKNAIFHEQVHLVGHPRLEESTMQSASLVSRKDITLYMPRKLSEGCVNGPIQTQFRYLEAFGVVICLETLSTYHANLISYGGNSGSPVLDDFGRVVGVLFAGSRDAVTATYLVPLEYIHQFLKDY